MKNFLLIILSSILSHGAYALNLKCGGKLTFQSGPVDAEKSIDGLFLYLNAKKTVLEAEHETYKGSLTLDNKWEEENNVDVYQYATEGFAVNLFFTPNSYDCGKSQTVTELKEVLIAHKPHFIPETKIYDLSCECLD